MGFFVASHCIKTRFSGKLVLMAREMDNVKRKLVEGEHSTDQKPTKSLKFSENVSLEDIRKIQETFSRERNWDQFHSPRNILLALVGEVGELAELFQWKGEVKEGLPGWSDKERISLGHELSDVLIYLVRLADRCHIDLSEAVLGKFEINKQKYPVDRVKGSSKKYTEYPTETGAKEC